MTAGRPGVPKILAAVVAAVLTTDARALWDDRVEVFASETFTYDENVFRLSDDQDPLTAVGSPSTSDTYYTTAFGLQFDVPASAQQFIGHVTWSRYRFRSFEVLDLDGHEGQVEWRWQVGESLHGEAGYGEELTLASPANIQNGIQSTAPNFLDTNRKYFNANYNLAAGWQIGAGVSRLQQSNSAPEFQLSDASSDSADLTLTHVTKASTRLGVRGRMTDGHLPNMQTIDGISVDNSYRQRSISAFLEWPVTSQSSVGASVGPVSRRHVQLPERDFNTVAYMAAYEWRPTARLTMRVTAEKDISAEEQVNVGFVLVERISLYSQFRQSEKLDWSMYLAYSDRTYLGHPTLVLDPTASPRNEQASQGGIRLAYRPSPRLTLELSARRQARASVQPFGDYDTSIYSVGVRVAF